MCHTGQAAHLSVLATVDPHSGRRDSYGSVSWRPGGGISGRPENGEFASVCQLIFLST